MTRTIPAMLFATSILLLNGCGSADDETRPVDSEVAIEGAGDDAALQPGDTSLADPATGSVTAPADVSATGEADADAAIPVALRGRWGMTVADCTGPAGEAKGLMTVDADSLKFYESVGTLIGADERSRDGLRGQFAFMGEGMEWRREMMLTRSGDALTRREYGAEATPGQMRYRRCAA